MNIVKVLLVCTANICRSPMAELIFKHNLISAGVDHLYFIDSAGTHAANRAPSPDPRVIKILQNNDVEVFKLKTRRVEVKDIEEFDHILVMDLDNYQYLMGLCTDQYREKISLIMKYAGDEDTLEVPDPYFGNISGFDKVYSMLNKAIGAFIERQR